MSNELDLTEIGSQLETLGWRQGSVIKDEDIPLILQHVQHDFVIQGNIAVVATQSCDIANNKLPDDPYVEVIIGQSIEELTEDYAYNKHPRILQVVLKNKTSLVDIFQDIFVQFKAFQKIQIPKTIFLNLQPSTQLFLVNQDLRSFVSWLAARYSRPALPTAFNDRIEKVDRKRKRRKIAKSLDATVTGLYVEIFPDSEVNEEENYSVNLLALVSPEFEGEFGEIERLVNDAAEIMRLAEMKVEYRVSREDNISVATLRRFKRLYYDDLSIRNNNESAPEVDLQL